MNFQSLRSLLVASVIASTAALLAACGGGGAGGNPDAGGALSFSPAGENTTFYAGNPVTIHIFGGKAPYTVTSSDTGILPVPSKVESNSFTIVPNNPGVVDTGLAEGALPVRTIQLTVRESTGLQFTSTVRVAQNFLTGYGVAITPTNCPPGTAGPVQACAGGESAIRLAATFNGALAGNRQFRLQVLKGNFSIRNPATGQSSSSITLTSDHAGVVTAVIEVSANVPSQLAVIRVTDVATGVYSDTVFSISGQSQSQNLNAVPNTFRFTGALTTQCGTGSAEFLVFDGTPPYTAVSSFPSIVVTPISPNTNPGRFQIAATNPNQCISDGTVVVTDSRGGVVTVTVTTEPGTTEPVQPPTFAVGPTALTLGCGQSGSVVAIGGTGNYFGASTNPNVTVSVSGNTITLTRLPTGTVPTSGAGATTATVPVGVSDGRTVINVTANVTPTCP